MGFRVRREVVATGLLSFQTFRGSLTAYMQTGQFYRLSDVGISSLKMNMSHVFLLLAAQVLPTTLYVPIDGSPQGNLNEMNCPMPT